MAIHVYRQRPESKLKQPSQSNGFAIHPSVCVRGVNTLNFEPRIAVYGNSGDGIGWHFHFNGCSFQIRVHYFYPQDHRRWHSLFLICYQTSRFVTPSALSEIRTNTGLIFLLGATEQLPISHLFIQSTALSALSNICVLRWQKRRGNWHLFNILLLAPNFGAVLCLLWINKQTLIQYLLRISCHRHTQI